MERFDGLILKGVGGFYTVLAPEGPVVCRPRGRFRLDGIKPLPGDRVSCVCEANGIGRIEEIHPRKNVFARPPVANMEALVIVASRAIPKSDPFLIDQMTIMAARRGLRVMICVNKVDLHPAEKLIEIYRGAGYETLCVSAQTGEGIQELRTAIAGQVVALAGNSGVGKSSLLNRLRPDLSLETAEVSIKGGRGRHTTRHVELISMGEDAWVADTPGFSLFEWERMETLEPEDLWQLFPESVHYEGQCRFTGCLHLGKNGCAVQQAVEEGAVAPSRFESYLRMMESIKENYGK